MPNNIKRRQTRKKSLAIKLGQNVHQNTESLPGKNDSSPRLRQSLRVLRPVLRFPPPAGTVSASRDQFRYNSSGALMEQRKTWQPLRYRTGLFPLPCNKGGKKKCATKTVNKGTKRTSTTAELFARGRTSARPNNVGVCPE